MRPLNKPKSKKHYYILLNGDHVGESWAVSADKAITNWWWKNIKCENEFSPRDYDPKDFDAIEAPRRSIWNQ